MSTFYLLPPRAVVGKHFADFLSSLFPGTGWTPKEAVDLAEALGAAASTRPEVYVVFNEDVTEGPSLEATLQADFGAEPGDEIVRIRVDRESAEVVSHRSRFESSRAG